MAEMGEPSKLDGPRACVQDPRRMEKEVLSLLRRCHFSSFLEMDWAERLCFAYTRLDSAELETSGEQKLMCLLLHLLLVASQRPLFL